MARLLWKLGAAALAASVLIACGDDDEDDGGDGIAINIAGGNGQSGVPGTALANPLQVSVEEDDVPLEGQTVTWSTNDGGTFDPATSVTDADGLAETIWTLGPGTATQTATASIPSGSQTSVTFTASAGEATITVANDNFSPSTLTLPAGGGEVTWVWAASAVNHNVKPVTTNPSAIPNSGGAQSDLNSAPFEFSATFTQSGTYRYFCTNHGAENPPGSTTGMSGSVVVP